MNIIGHRRIFYVISGIAIGASVIFVFIFGLRPGIDFTGGSILDIEFQGERPDFAELEAALTPLNLGEIRLQPTGERGLLTRTRHLTEEEHQFLVVAFGNEAIEKRFDTVGPSIGRELRFRAGVAVALVILLIVLYIAFAFRTVSNPVASWTYGLVTIVALLHDILIPAGFFAVFGQFTGFEVDTLFVTALLTILGFSVHDTIVVFDRIRENLRRERGVVNFSELVNQSVRQTLVRSINTSATVLLALIPIYFFGGRSTEGLALTLIVGIIVGTYSSIFIASPLLVSWHLWQERSVRA